MDRESFVELVEEVLDALPVEFKKRIQNLTVLVEDQPTEQLSRKIIESAEEPGSEKTHSVLLGFFQGVPATKRSVFNLSSGPDRIVLYQKNIEAVCSSQAQIRRQVRQTVLHELGHYFGMDEAQLRDV
jgi:predicted Zn-dependent protease with MMP-like domain